MHVGVIVGRFQIPSLHSGHKHLIDTVIGHSDRIVICIGVTEYSTIDENNPLSYLSRKAMIEESYPEAIIVPIHDCQGDNIWSYSLDRILKQFNHDDIILYGSRDSFIKSYVGKHLTIEVNEIEHISGTKIRNELLAIDSYDYRVAVINTIQILNRQNASFTNIK